jgi:flagellar biosynthesis/type III secretory pathway protein FliH
LAPKKRSIPPLEDLPKSFRMAVVRVMAKFNLDYVEAFERAAILVDVNSRAYEIEVVREAESRYNSRFMSQLNKGRATIERNLQERLDAAYNNGYNTGYNKAKSEFRIFFNCPACGQPADITPNSDAHLAINEFLRSRGWRHSACLKRRG